MYINFSNDIIVPLNYIYDLQQKPQQRPSSFLAGVLCDHYLQRMSEFIGEEWISLGRNLGIPDRDLRLLQIDFKDKAERNYKLLDTFRLSRTAIEQGSGVIRFLLRACKGAGCTAGLITFIRYIAGIFKEQTFMRSQSWMSLSSAMPSVEITQPLSININSSYKLVNFNEFQLIAIAFIQMYAWQKLFLWQLEPFLTFYTLCFILSIYQYFFNCCICFLTMMVVDIIINRNTGVYRC